MHMRARPALRLRRDRALGDAARGRDAARDRRPRHGGAAHAGRSLPAENLTTVGEFTVAAGETVPFVLTYAPSHLPPPQPLDAQAALDADRGRSGPTGRPSAGRPATWSEAVRPLADHAQGADLRADRRHRRGADHVAARAARRRAQLGLSLLLAARCDAHAARADERRLLSRRRRPGATGCCARSPAVPSRCRSCTASPASGG